MISICRIQCPRPPVIWICVLIVVAALNPGLSRAMDEGGCLTCHQYPGLTRPDGNDEFEVLHIDEERFLLSPHGQTDCRKCHTTIHKVPHTGETSVSCTDNCHLSPKERKRVAEFDLKNMHAAEKSYIIRLADGSSCRVCHALYPHRSNELARAFINMHIGFMVCETCHINRDRFTSLQYAWTDSETAEFAGKPFGAHFNPKVEDTAVSAHFISRITVFNLSNGIPVSLFNTRDAGKARVFLQKEKNLGPAEREEQLAYFHQDIHKLEISLTCNACHAKTSILDFKQLGFSEKAAADLINLNIKGLVTKYKVFYFPGLLQR